MDVNSKLKETKSKLEKSANRKDLENHISALIWDIKCLKSANYFYTKVLPDLEKEYLTIALVHGAYKFRNKINDKSVDFYPRRRRLFNCKARGWITVYRKSWIKDSIKMALS